MAHPPIPPVRIPASKIAVPELPAEFTSRPLLLNLLDMVTAGQVVVVSAPAGSGKTLLLTDWVRATGGRPETAWVALDPDDNEPRRLWSAVVTALLALAWAGPDSPLRRVAAVTAVPGGTDVVEYLADALDDLGWPVRLVLDDVHELTGRE